MSRFTVMHLQESRFDETLPLVRMSAPLVTLERWRQFTRWLCDNGGGVLAAFAGDGRPHGIAAYRADESLIHGRTLQVEPMVTFEINRSAPARATLCEALELLAAAKGCDSLIIATGSRGYADPQCAKAVAWASLGLEIVSVALAKRLNPVRSTSPAVLAP